MKKNTMASKFEKSWTVLLVDGQGRIRRIRNFRQKFWAIIGLSLGALILAGVMGTFYGGAVRKQVALSNEVADLRQQIQSIQQQNDVLKARAVRMEAQAAKAEKPVKAKPAPAPSPPKPVPVASKTDGPAQLSSPAPKADPEPPKAEEKPAEKPSPPEKKEENQDPRVDAESLKLAYTADTQTIDAQFVIKNTGQGSAGGRAVVVLHTETGQSQLRFALPSVQLRNGQPVGNRGRRFSIARFMTLKLNRKFAEPGTRFVGAVVYAYTLDGKPLLEKAFDVALEIPKPPPPPQVAPTPEPPPQVAPTPEPPPEETDTTVTPFGIKIPDAKPEENTGAQP